MRESWVAVTLVLMTFTACPSPSAAPPTKAQQCGTLREAIETHEKPVQELIDQGMRVLRKTAAAHEEAGAAVGALPLADDRLIDFRRRYADTVRDLASARRDLADAIEAGDKVDESRAEARIATSNAVAKNLAAEIAGYCDAR